MAPALSAAVDRAPSRSPPAVPLSVPVTGGARSHQPLAAPSPAHQAHQTAAPVAAAAAFAVPSPHGASHVAPALLSPAGPSRQVAAAAPSDGGAGQHPGGPAAARWAASPGAVPSHVRPAPAQAAPAVHDVGQLQHVGAPAGPQGAAANPSAAQPPAADAPGGGRAASTPSGPHTEAPWQRRGQRPVSAPAAGAHAGGGGDSAAVAAAQPAAPEADADRAARALGLLNARQPGLHALGTVADILQLCDALQDPSVTEVAVTPLVPLRAPAVTKGAMPPPPDSEELLALLKGGRIPGEASDWVKRPEQRLEGLAFCWAEGRVFYVPLQTSERVSKLSEYWDRVAAVLASPRTCILACGVKDAMLHLKDVLPPRAQPRSSGRRCSPMRIGPNYADVRLEAFMLNPGGSAMQEAVGDAPKPRPLSRGRAEPAGPAERIFAERSVLFRGCAAADYSEPADLYRFNVGVAGGVPPRVVAAAREALYTLALHRRLQPALLEQSLQKPLLALEQPIVRVLAALQHRGMPLDVSALQEQADAIKRVQESYNKKARDVAKKHGIFDFAIGGPANQQVPTLLWDKLKISPPHLNAKQTRSGHAPTDKSVLTELLKDPNCNSVVRYILEHRSNEKLLEFYDGLLTAQPHAPHYDATQAAAGSRVFMLSGNVIQTNSATGRIAMDRPNLQCMPKSRAVLDYTAASPSSPSSSAMARAAAALDSDGADSGALGGGRPDTEEMLAADDLPPVVLHANVRAAFRAPQGWVILSADYRQLELRLMAHIAQEQRLLTVFGVPSADPFRALAAEVHGKPLQVVTEVDRANVKGIAYGLLYGMGPAALSMKLDCGVAEAEAWRSAFLARFPRICEWQKEVVAGARARGYVSTIAGRKRWLPELRGRDDAARAAERAAVNTVCQGSAADVVKFAMLRLEKELPQQAPDAARMVLQIHDELLFLVREGAVGQAARVIRQVMEEAVSAPSLWTLQVSLPVQLKVGPSWGELVDYAPPVDG